MAFRIPLLTRDDPLDQDYSSFTPGMANIIISVLFLVAFICGCFGAYLLLRRRRQISSRSLLPTHSKSTHHRQLSISTSFEGPRHSSIYVYDEKHASSPSNGSVVPEIRITFPDEEGASEKTRGGRVVIVKVGDSGTVGMEPVKDDFLPPYQTSGRFQSIDMDRIGGLKDAKEPRQWS
jgi:hypothetical protein